MRPSARLHAVDHDSLLRHALAGQGEVIIVGGDRPFRLDTDDAWIVESGHVDIFSVVRSADGTLGARAHLLRVGEGKSIFGFGDVAAGDRDRTLVGVGTNGTRLWRLPQQTLRVHAADATFATAVFELIDGWIELLCAGISRDIVPKRCADLDEDKEVVIEHSTAARPRANVSWIRHLEGHSYLLGRERLRVNGSGYTPVSRRAWLQVTEKSRVEVLPTAHLASPDALWWGLRTLHALVLEAAALFAAQAESSDHERLERRRRTGEQVLTDACVELAAAMHTTAPHLTAPRPSPASGDPHLSWHQALLAAVRVVGAASGITIKSYPVQDGAALPRDPLAAIARASRIRTRRVALREEWWTQDNGPLLGSIEDDKRPVALVPSSAGGYVMHDTLRGSECGVDAELAQQLHAFGYSIYRPFADSALSIRDVLAMGARGSGRDFAMVIAMGIAGALLGTIPAMATGRLFNTVIPGAERSQLAQMTLVLIVCAIAAAMFNLTRAVALLRVEGRMAGAMQSAVWDRLLSLPMPFFRQFTAGDLATRAMSVDAIRQVVSGTTVTAILGGVFSLFNFGLMFYYSSVLAWRASLLIAIAVAVTALGSYLQLSHQRTVLGLQARTSGLVLQLLSSITKLRVAGAERHGFAQWARWFSAQRRIQYKVKRIANWVQAFNAAFPIAAMAILFWAALPLLQQGTMIRTGDFLAFLAAYGSCQGALLGTCAALLSTLHVIPLYEQAKPILVTLPEVDVGKSDPGVLGGDISIQHATFRYGVDGPQVLRDLTLNIAAGEFVAFVGPSGSGKSTVLRLLLGFESLESGAIYYDGQELGGLDVQAVRRQIGVVLQNGRLMSGDIFTNIVGSAPLGMEDAWEASRMAGFEEDVKAMPMGMHTVISEGGGTLSGGQRQRLMIARAIVQRPRILFFDEATSALDNRTQAVVSASLERLNATRVVVAHRLSTIVNADRIVVIERGQIVQTGTYTDLLGQPGLFADLARRQLT